MVPRANLEKEEDDGWMDLTEGQLTPKALGIILLPFHRTTAITDFVSHLFLSFLRYFPQLPVAKQVVFGADKCDPNPRLLHVSNFCLLKSE